MSHWSHGYNVSQGYTYDCFRELSPLWIGWAAQMNGAYGPMPGGSNYLELGCGQGVGLVILAACYPNMRFIGVDFNPAHIAHARLLAASADLGNVEFVEADFISLAENWPSDWPAFDYVVLHGICSWIPEIVRQSVVTCLQHSLAPGGLAYVSYNALPGWTSSQPLQHLLCRYQVTTGKSGVEALSGGKELMQHLIDQGATMGRALPLFKGRLESLANADPSYLVHEYLHEYWRVFWFSQIATEMAQAKLSFIASATLTDNYLLALLPDGLTRDIKKTSDPSFQQELLDVCINQSFRRDIFQRGDFKPWAIGGKTAQENVRLMFLQTPEGDAWSFKLSMGVLEADMKLYEPVLMHLKQRESTVGEVLSVPQLASYTPAQILQAIAILADRSHIARCRTASREEIASAQKLNKAIANAVAQGAPYSTLACAHFGGGLKISAIDWLMLDSLGDCSDTDDLQGQYAGLVHRLQRLDRHFVKNGQPVTDPAETSQEAALLWTAFLTTTLPEYRRWGAWQ